MTSGVFPRIILGIGVVVMCLIQAAPTDVTWVDGIYDAADFDQAVHAGIVTSAVLHAPVVRLEPDVVVIEAIRPPPLTGIPSAAPLGFGGRAPPVL